jgi:Ni,Fe-hydrogenase maturation factor
MIKVIGIGNRLMMDDGIAIAVLESIRMDRNHY